MKRIVVLGTKGMAGHVIAEYFDGRDAYEVFGLARESGNFTDVVLDVSNFSKLEEYLSMIKPDIVINCIGVLIAAAKDNISKAILLNSYLPHFLADLGRSLHYKVVHISTDCVFSGRQGGYAEDSYRDGDDNYARTKALGELSNSTDLTVRTSIIGPELKPDGTGLLDWFFKQSGSIDGYTNAFWSGVTTVELAHALEALIQQDIRGLYHLCPKQKIAKFDLLRLAADVWKKNINIRPMAAKSVDKSLVCTRIDFQYPALDYRKMLDEAKEWMDERSDCYTHYER
jgi:dTDP-4-dehydrorhamnose reductase